MQVAYSKTRERFPLSYKKVIKKTIVSMFAYLAKCAFIVSLMLGMMIYYKLLDREFFSRINLPVYILFIMFGLIIIVILLIYFYQRWYFSVYFYDLTPDYIQIKKGPITPREITIPYERIQDVYVDQDILDRIFGLYDVHLSSATVSSGIEAHIDGVEKESADGLRAMLLETVKQRISKNVVAIPLPNKQ